jgi:hypothetical protein
VEGNLEDASLLSALGLIDAAMGRKKEAITVARHAAEMLRSKDARDDVALVCNLLAVYALIDAPEHAFPKIAVSIENPGGHTRSNEIRIGGKFVATGPQTALNRQATESYSRTA